MGGWAPHSPHFFIFFLFLSFSHIYFHFLNFFFHFLSLSFIFFHFLSFSVILFHVSFFFHFLSFSLIFLSFSHIYFHLLIFSFIFFHFLSFSVIFFRFLSFSFVTCTRPMFATSPCAWVTADNHNPQSQGGEYKHVTVWLDVRFMPAAAYTALSRVARMEDLLLGGELAKEHFVPANCTHPGVSVT